MDYTPKGLGGRRTGRTILFIGETAADDRELTCLFYGVGLGASGSPTSKEGRGGQDGGKHGKKRNGVMNGGEKRDAAAAARVEEVLLSRAGAFKRQMRLL